MSRRPPEELDDRLVALSRHSLTSVYLVKLLLEKAYHVRPQYAGDDRAGEAEARLVIGDEALRLGPRFPHSVDLGKAWYALTGLPFVFAVWVVRAEGASAAAEVRALHGALLAAKAHTRAHPETIQIDGRKRFAGAAIFSGLGRLVAVGRATWIQVPASAFTRG